MIIECPKCKSTFSITSIAEMNKFSNLKCSICEHIWKIDLNNDKTLLTKEKISENNYSYILILNFVIMMFVIVALVLFKDTLIYSNDFWRNFYEFFFNLIPIK